MDGDNVRLSASGIEGVSDSGESGSKVEGDHQAFIRRVGDGG